MTEEQKANDANRYIVVDEGEGAIEGSYEAEGEARKGAETWALRNPGTEYIVYAKIGTAKAEVQVNWKGAAR